MILLSLNKSCTFYFIMIVECRWCLIMLKFCWIKVLVTIFVLMFINSQVQGDKWNTTQSTKAISTPLHSTNIKKNTSASTDDRNNLKTIYGHEKVCNKTWFIQNYVKHKRHIDIVEIRALCNDTQYLKCKGVEVKKIDYQLMEGIRDPEYILRFYIQGMAFSNPGCWGYAFEEITRYDKKTRYFNFFDQVNETQLDLHYKLGANYTFRIGALPSAKIFQVEWKAPVSCHLEVLHDIHRKLVERGLYWTRCKNELDLIKQLKFAKGLCRYRDLDLRRKILKERLDFVGCRAVLRPDVRDNKEDLDNTTMISLAVAATMLAVIFIMFILLARKNKLKFCSKSSREMLHPYDLEDRDIEIKSSANPKDVPHIMILHRPGCEALESFVLELTGLLRSHGIEVKTTLCEQTLVDSEGGIASYMQRNIFKCDYVLILLTEATENDALMNHRAFEFAIAMIQGLAVHSNSYSKYIPIYFTSYYEAVKFFPPFLNASTSYGYRLPHETMRLIARLLRTTNLKQSKERTIKDKVFLDKMKHFTKDVLRYRHTNCIVERCRKGTQYTSTSDLSSVWKSTIHSKWMSTKSILDQDDDDINGCMESKGLGTMNNGSIQLSGLHARGENPSNPTNKLNFCSMENDEALDNEAFYADNIKIDQVKDWRIDSAKAERHQIHILPPFYAHYSTSSSSCDDLTCDHYYTGKKTFLKLSLSSAGGSVDEHRAFLGSTEDEGKTSIV